MSRSFASTDLVQLPRLDAVSAQTLGTQLLTAARDKRLPEAIVEALDELATSHRALQRAATERLPLGDRVDPNRARSADYALDASWSALFDLLTGWSKLPGHDHATVASRVRAQLFPEGLRFIQLAYKLQWSESNTRLTLIKERRLDADLEKLGATPIYKRLREAHKEYGEALNITSAAELTTVNNTVRQALDEFCDSLRHYIVRVAASVKRRDEKSALVAQALLAPLEAWQSGPVTRAESEPIQPPAPAPTQPTVANDAK
jgi:hypothetical protein